MVYNEISGWLETSENPIVLWVTVVPLAFAFLGLLLYIVFKPFITKAKQDIQNHSPHNMVLQFSKSVSYSKKNIAKYLKKSIEQYLPIVKRQDIDHE